ncbi:putative Zn-dependent peptidase, insulinase-like [Balamuthia mandrillaris]
MWICVDMYNYFRGIEINLELIEKTASHAHIHAAAMQRGLFGFALAGRKTPLAQPRLLHSRSVSAAFCAQRTVRACPSIRFGGSRPLVGSIPRGRALHTAASTTAPPVVSTIATAAPNLKRGEERERCSLSVGDRLHGYRVLRVTPVPERNFMTYHLIHEATGAEHFHVDCADNNNAFFVTLKTIPTDSTGVAHILEHTTLCGSQKYPVRDPFFNMLKRSMNTYMNAYTAPDHTSYPFATQNAQDFKNLLSVYLNCVFFPLLQEMDFRQEGHRLEFEQLTDASSPLKFKGVVYNEMKGALSDSNSLFAERLTMALYPTTTYHYNSGGEPSDIPSLSYDALRSFHQRHYHPSNARFYTYGDLSLSEHLKFIHDECLSHFEKEQQQQHKISPPVVPDEQRFTSPQRVETTAPPIPGADPERQNKFAIAWLANNTTDTFETLCMSLLSKLLLDGPNAPMHKALIESNIGLDYAPSTGYNPGAREASFAVGLSGIVDKDIERVESIIMSTLEEAAKDGFPQERIDSILHQLEIGLKHVTSDFGMTVGSGINYSWIHGNDPVNPILFDKNIGRLKEELATQGQDFFKQRIKKYLLENQHRVALVMRPDEQYLSKQDKEEHEKLRKIRSKLTPQDVEAIIEQGKTLKEKQETTQDVSCLPTLHLSDVPKEAPGKDVRLERRAVPLSRGMEVPLLAVPQPTNGLTYFRALLDIHSLPKELTPYVPLFASVFTEMGAGKMDYRQFAQEIETYTGGIGVSANIILHPNDVSQYKNQLYLHSYCLDRNLSHMFDLIQTVFNEPKFDDLEHLQSLISQMTSDAQESLISSGHSYAKSTAAAVFSDAFALSEEWQGVSNVRFLQQLLQKGEFELLAEKFKAIANHVLDSNRMRCSLVAEESTLPVAENKMKEFLANLRADTDTSHYDSKAGYKSANFRPLTEERSTFIPLPASVNFVVKCLPSVPYQHPDAPSLRVIFLYFTSLAACYLKAYSKKKTTTKPKVLASLLSSQYLHREIREKGGAYGGGALSGEGLFAYYSYRDPNTTQTLDVYRRSLDWLQRSESFTEQDLEEAKMRLFSSLDSPVAPSNQGTQEFLRDITYEMRQRHREALFATTRADLLSVADRYLDDREGKAKASIAILGATEKAEDGQHEEDFEEEGERQ